jgi:uncharacterized protein YkwD
MMQIVKSAALAALLGLSAWWAVESTPSPFSQGSAKGRSGSEAWARDIARVWKRDVSPGLAQLGDGIERATRQVPSQAGLFPSLGPTPKPPSGAQLSLYERRLCDLANQERRKLGLPLLKISPALAEVARAHSREMAAKGFFDHESPTPQRRTLMQRYRLKFKRPPRLVAENIYKLEGPSFYRMSADDFRRAHTGWMNSPGHRANILRTSPSGGPSEIGVGIFVRNGSFWATQNFARPQ